MDASSRSRSEPVLNVPFVVLATAALIFLVHLARQFVDRETDVWVLLYLAFIPARYDATALLDGPAPGGIAADIWTFVTYAFLHADWTHLAVNGVWLLAFGSAVARRFGTLRFALFFAATAAAGALAHLVANASDYAPLVGASGALSGLMAAAARFAFAPGAPLGAWRRADESAYRLPAVPLLEAFRNPRVVAFLAVWFALNLVFGLGSIGSEMAGAAIAWEAHLGGFLAGLAAFAWFDPVPRAPR